MPIITTRTNRILLHQPIDDYENLTGGWTLNNGDTVDFVFATSFLREEDFLPENEDILNKGALGSICVYIKHRLSDFDIYSVSFKTNNPIKFHHRHKLKFIFTRRNLEFVPKLLRRYVYITLEDQSGDTIYRTWDCSGKTCWYERGIIDVTGLDEAYINIHVGMSLMGLDAFLLTNIEENVTTEWDEYVVVHIDEADGDTVALATRYGEEVYTKNDELVITYLSFGWGDGESNLDGFAYMDISDMWLE